MRTHTLRLLLILVVLPIAARAEMEPPPSIRLYAMDCGRLILQPAGMSLFEDTDAYAGVSGVMSVPCFLVRHPLGDLLWDTGLGDELAGRGTVDLIDGISAEVTATLRAQLEALDVAPADIEFIAFSHHHFDHTGNAPLFTSSTYLISRREMEWTRRKPSGVTPDDLRFATDANTRLVEHDWDVFGDGSVRILRTAGHTPGHQVLMLRLENAGTVILSGDLWHTRENFRRGRVATLNHSRAETLASFDRVARLIERYDARVIVQHDPADVTALPEFPAFLD